MKSTPYPRRVMAHLLVSAALLASSVAVLTADEPDLLYFDRTGSLNWMGGSSWSETQGGPYDTGWTDGALAIIRAGTQSPNAVTITLDQSISAYGIIRGSTSGDTIQKSTDPTSPVTLTLQGGPVQGGQNSGATSSGTLSIDSGVTLTGDFVFEIGTFTLAGDAGTYGAHSGAITIDGTGTALAPVLNVNASHRTSAGTTFTIDSGGAFFRAASHTIGDVDLTKGQLRVGGTGGEGDMALSMGNLSGDLESDFGVRTVSSFNLHRTHTITINQTSNTEFAGTVIGFQTAGTGTGSASLVLEKAGSGDLILSGDIYDMQRTVSVLEGGLFINSEATAFGDIIDGIAIAVANGAALGGSGTIATQNDTSVVLAAGAFMVAGTVGLADRTTYALGAGGELDLSAASGSAGWLRFDLVSAVAGGVTYSQINLISGTVLIGDDSLGFSDFDFNLLAGFGAGLYELFDTTGIDGTLSGDVSGQLAGLDAALFIDGGSLYLQVIPEPSALALVAGLIGLGLVMWRRR